MTKVLFRRVATFGNTLLAAAAASWCCKSAVEADFPVLLAVGITLNLYLLLYRHDPAYRRYLLPRKWRKLPCPALSRA